MFGFNLLSGVNVLGMGILDMEDFVVSNILLPLGSLVYLLFCVTKFGWGFDNYYNECNTGRGMKLPRIVKPYLQYVLPILILIVFAQKVYRLKNRVDTLISINPLLMKNHMYAKSIYFFLDFLMCEKLYAFLI